MLFPVCHKSILIVSRPAPPIFTLGMDSAHLGGRNVRPKKDRLSLITLATTTFCAMPGPQKLSVTAASLPKPKANFDFARQKRFRLHTS
jgi:hypothetical protein